MQEEYDVAIAGGGPIGGYVAYRIASHGFKVALFEQHQHIGLPLRCAGLVSSRVFDFVPFLKPWVLQNKIKGAHIHSPSGQTLSIGGNQIHAFAINRTTFDQKIINASREQGTEVYLKNRVSSIKKHQDYIILATSQHNTIKCKLLVGADGPYSITRKQLALPNPIEILHGYGAEISHTSLNPDYVEIFLGTKIAPGFFAWMIPTNKEGTEARVGVCTNKNAPHPPKYYFSRLYKNKFTRRFLDKTTPIRKIAGAIPCGLLKKTYAPHFLLVGDAASQVKPVSGGGVYTGLLCADLCASTVIEALKRNKFSMKFLKRYQKLWTAEIGREIYKGMQFRKIFQNLTDNQIDKYLTLFQEPKIVNIITKYGDIDYPSKLIKPLIAKVPSLIRLLPHIIRG